MSLAESQFPLTGWQMHLVTLAAAAVTYGGAYWVYNAFPAARRRLAEVLLLLGAGGFFFACAVGLRIVFRSLSRNDGFMTTVVVFSAASLLVGFWIVMLEKRDRDRGGPAGP
jgi:hypothetical protein